ncbi:MAG: hypothetical protein AAGC85_17490 [Bacteroidota bacterium]
MPHSLKNFTNNLLAEGNTASALNILQETLHASQPDLYKQVIILSARFKRLEKSVSKGIIDDRDEKLERNQINYALTELIQEIPEEMEISSELKEVYARKRNRWIITSLGYVLILGALGWLGFMPQKKLYAQLELHLSRVTFTSLNELNLFEGKVVSGVMLQDFDKLAIQAFNWDAADGEGKIPLPEERINLRLHPDIPGGSAYLDTLRMEGVSLLEEKPVSIEVLTSKLMDEESGQVQLDYELPEALPIRMNYRDSLHLATTYLVGRQGEEEYDFIGQETLSFYCPDKNCEVIATTDTGIQHVYFDTPKGITYTETEVEVSDISFTRSEDNREVSALLGGSLSLKEPKKDPYRELSFGRNDYLGIKPKEKLTLTELSVSSEEVFIRADGYLEVIRAGSENKMMNPSRLEWLWENYRFELSAVFVLSVILLVLLPGRLSESILTRIERIRRLL